MQIIPAIDLIDGQCVRLTKGDYDRKKIYARDPVEIARRLADAGLSRLHLVDLDGAKAGRVINSHVLAKISAKTALQIDFSGGLRGPDDLRMAFENGAAMVSIGSVAVKNPDMFLSWLQTYGADKIILSADVRDAKIAIAGWREDTTTDIFGFLEKNERDGVRTVICTDIERDGLLAGPAFDLYQKLGKSFPGLNLIASGGISGAADLDRLAEMNVFGVIIGKAIYEGKIQLKDLERWLC